MGIIKEPKGVDFYVVNKPVTEEDKKFISDIIAHHKASGKKKRNTVRGSKKTEANKHKQ